MEKKAQQMPSTCASRAKTILGILPFTSWIGASNTESLGIAWSPIGATDEFSLIEFQGTFVPIKNAFHAFRFAFITVFA
jgi:hypothetical protein